MQDFKNPPLQENFEVDRFMGKWYQIARKKGMQIPDKNTNINMTYTKKDEKKFRGNLQMKNDKGQPKKKELNYEFKGPTNVPHFKVSIGMPFKGDFRVLKTDYVNFFVGFGHKKIVFKTVKYAMILCRDKNIDPKLLDELFEHIEKVTGLKRSEFVIVHHD